MRLTSPGFFCIIFLSFFLCSHTKGQERENYVDQSAIVARVHYGFLLAHRPRVEHLVRHTAGFEISLSRQRNGEKLWEQYYKYPQTGYSYIFLDFNNPEVLGYAHGLMTFINFPFVRTHHFQFSMRLASGLGYVTKKYERVENYKNDVIGSHLNAAIQINFETRYRLSQRLYFNANIGITHFSNGSFRTPNLGINNPAVNSGFTYQLQDSKEFTRSAHPAPGKSPEVDLLYGAGVKENYPPTGRKYFAHTISSTVLKPVNHKVRLGLGLDVFYDLGLLKAFDNENKKIDSDFKIIRSGIHFDHELMVGKLSILFQMGAYWLDQYKGDGIFYHRIGFKYLVNNHLFLNLSLKTHFAKADFVECGFGWKFGKVNVMKSTTE
ncbi:MAG: acyloxyacyl hydrolase [Bacteroidetes bacterium]|nr:acyloxyacyl hydrolase [Bacteroidota bacterium]